MEVSRPQSHTVHVVGLCSFILRHLSRQYHYSPTEVVCNLTPLLTLEVTARFESFSTRITKANVNFCGSPGSAFFYSTGPQQESLIVTITQCDL